MNRNILRLSITFVGIALALLFFTQITTGQGGFPHAIYGTVSSDDGTSAVGASVSVENMETGDVLTTTTDENSRYQVDLSSMPAGYATGDRIKVEVELGDYHGESEITVSSGPNDECNVVISEVSNESDDTLLWLSAVAGIITLIIIIVSYIMMSKKDEPATKKRRRK